jgi:hypothetical protein
MTNAEKPANKPINLTIISVSLYNNLRCYNCGKLLGRHAGGITDWEIKCPKCKVLNKFKVKP